jgi:hypothetical protein
MGGTVCGLLVEVSLYCFIVSGQLWVPHSLFILITQENNFFPTLYLNIVMTFPVDEIRSLPPLVQKAFHRWHMLSSLFLCKTKCMYELIAMSCVPIKVASASADGRSVL